MKYRDWNGFYPNQINQKKIESGVVAAAELTIIPIVYPYDFG
jgi:hypothetical protein